ncbi:MAG TPA: endonuclease III [Deltaproteobacteria bacterium]|nr:MAG: endonuclease III [Deltaproteobacteria bacterium GWA2_55_82]OGQ64148.1 MAG: endonuclease III [Deltaproteobacteria bacterium RIFCSPLOWO2_02_FULL_55_12]OIJ74600.1 MAG: endonuclease III [Deltaproteobacteria bacterium GWC2_55_46]HBG46457.1 endonuclease III [Deltaproteobacteria bacterium]HCY10669.1 endonuclease III [Deltaproteobacteria bacterium]
MDRKEKAAKVLGILEKEFPDARSALEYKNPLELLISTILSAQATDKLVNKVTQSLFKKYRTAKDYAASALSDLEGDISSINFYRNKARNIKACCGKLVELYGGDVPATLDGLTALPGVGRKTANIVLGNAFGKDALAVDTHVKRVSQRLGLTSADDPDKIEADLTSIIPPKRWTKATHLLILHGRKTCKAVNPDCDNCPIQAYSVYFKEVYSKKKK